VPTSWVSDEVYAGSGCFGIFAQIVSAGMGKAKFMTSSSSFPNSWASARARGSTWPSGCRTERFALNRLTRVSPSRCRRASKPSVRSSPNSTRWDRHHRHRRDRQRRKSATRADDRTLSVGDVRCVCRAPPAPCTSLWRAWPRSLLAQAQLQRESTDPMRWHESFSGSIRARRPDRQPALAPVTGRITSYRSLAADPMRLPIFNGRQSPRQRPRTPGSGRLALAKPTGLRLHAGCSEFAILTTTQLP